MVQQIKIIGCGVIGLTTGIRLLEAGYGVQIIARDLPPNTTSNWAAAIWFPYHVFPYRKVLRWGEETYSVFQTLLNVPEAGVRNTQLLMLTEEPPEEPWWGNAVPAYRYATADELPHGYAHGYSVTVPVCDTGLYLDYLLARYRDLGGAIEQREIDSFDELVAPNSVFINCSGLGSYQLANDRELYPVRGQVVKVRQPNVTVSMLRDFGEKRPSYIIPRTHDIILGGTDQKDDWNETVDPATAETILEQTKLLVPDLDGAEVLAHGVALRPGRTAVRLEAEQLTPDCTVIHNYGHGGAGFTVSWGCANEVVQMVTDGAASLVCPAI